MRPLNHFIENFHKHFPAHNDFPPWYITQNLKDILLALIPVLGEEYQIRNQVAIHQSAVVEEGVILKPPVIVGEKVFIGAHAYLRNGVYLGRFSSVGPGCEVKSTIILESTSLAHFNFIGDSIIGNRVNLEAGAVIANHFNERNDKRIFILDQGKMVETKAEKFGALVGDDSKIGANAVLSPGTILNTGSIVKRLELINQIQS